MECIFLQRQIDNIDSANIKNKTALIKYGGNAMTDSARRAKLIDEICTLKRGGLNVVIVHGGGPFIAGLLNAAGIQSEFIGGHRKTDMKAMPYVEMALKGRVNGDLVRIFNQQGYPAVGISGKDGGLSFARKRLHYEYINGRRIWHDLGRVGEIVHVNPHIIHLLLERDFIPVIAPVSAGTDGADFNVNADMFAGHIAGAIQADYYIAITDVDGLYRDKDNSESLINELTEGEAEVLLREKLSGGMIPKIDSILIALRTGVKEAIILNGNQDGRLIEVLTGNSNVCTKIKADNMQNGIQLENRHHFQIYKRYPIVLEKGSGVKVWDTQGREYLDALAGIAVNILGHAHPAVVQAIREQSGRLMHVTNLFYTDVQSRLAEKLTALSGYERVFFVNSGVEAIEGALKLARKHGARNGRHGEILFMENAFHGRSLAALAMGKARYQKGYEPVPAGFRSAKFNDFEAVNQINKDTVAVIVEVIQGEGGIIPAQTDWLKALNQACAENQVLLIADEIQCGMGRSGKFFAFEHHGIRPDIVTLAKGLGGGFPIGAVLADDETASVFQAGDHGTTFGGNPLACAAALAVLETLVSEQLIYQAEKRGQYLFEGLNKLAEQFPLIKSVRGAGLMAGIELSTSCAAIVESIIEKGVLVNCAAENVIRLLPPLIIADEEIDKVIEVIQSVLKEEQKK